MLAPVDINEFVMDLATLTSHTDFMYKYRFAHPLPEEREVLEILKINKLLEKLIDEPKTAADYSEKFVLLFRKGRKFELATNYQGRFFINEKEYNTLDEACLELIRRVIQSIRASRQVHGV